MNNLNISEIIDKAVDFGVNSLNGEKNALTIQIASFWLEGYICGNTAYLTKDDIKSLRAAMQKYLFD